MTLTFELAMFVVTLVPVAVICVGATAAGVVGALLESRLETRLRTGLGDAGGE